MSRLLLALCLAGSVQADIQINNDAIQETFTKTVEVSGSYLHGFQLASTPDSLSRDLHVFFPENTNGKLCIDITAIDGRYQATLEHDITTIAAGLTRITFSSDYQSELANYENTNLAVHSAIKERCDRKTLKTRLVSSWSAMPTTTLLMLVRSSATYDNALYEGNPETPCQKIESNTNVAFDKLCKINNFDISASGELVINRKNLQPIRAKKIHYN